MNGAEAQVVVAVARVVVVAIGNPAVPGIVVPAAKEPWQNRGAQKKRETIVSRAIPFQNDILQQDPAGETNMCAGRCK